MKRKCHCHDIGTRAVSILGSTPTLISEKKIIASINPNSDQWKGSMHAAPGSSSTLIIKKKTTWKGVATSSPTGSTHLLLNSIAFDLVACLIPEAPCHSKVWDWRRNKNIHVSGSSIASMHLGNWGSWKERRCEVNPKFIRVRDKWCEFVGAQGSTPTLTEEKTT